jgi:hypothetical protein
MLVFVDESYHEEKTPNAKSTFAAVLIEEDRYREFDLKLFDLKRHFWKVQTPYDLELKGRLLLNERPLVLPKNREFVTQFIALCKEVGAVAFAVVQDGTFPLASESNRLPRLYRALIWRVNTFMESRFASDQAIFFFDGIDHKTNRKVAISFNNFMFRHRWGQTYRNVIPTPFFCDSLVSPGIQMADVLAYCVNQRYGGRRGYLEEFFQQFRELSYNHENPDENFTLWGFNRIPPEPEEKVAAQPDLVIGEITLESRLEVREEIEEAKIRNKTGGQE